MTGVEKRLYFSQLLDLIGRALTKYFKHIRYLVFHEIQIIFRDLLQTARANHPSHCIRLIKTFTDALREDYDYILKLVDTRECEYILSCVANERVQEWDILRSGLLMEDLDMKNLRSVVLLKYGFPYIFEELYYNNLVNTIYNEGLIVKGKYLPRIFLETWFTGNLRLQMALEILSALFNKWDSVKKTIVATVWNSIPNPYISSAEMQHLLTPFFKDYPARLQEVCEEYVKCNTVFSVPEVTQPRSLQHLARVQLRRSLFDAYSLSDTVIDSLEIPRTLKIYLNLEM